MNKTKRKDKKKRKEEIKKRKDKTLLEIGKEEVNVSFYGNDMNLYQKRA